MRRLVRPLAFTIASAGALVGFVLLGRTAPAPLTWGDPNGWLDRTEPVDAFAELARHLGVVLSAYVAVVAAVALATDLAATAHMPRLHRRLRRIATSIAVPALRHRLLEVTTAATITASALQAAPAGAYSQSTDSSALVVDTTPQWTDAPILRGEFTGFGATSSVATSTTYTVQPGDTLWTIVDRHYGSVDTQLIDAVVDANPIIEDPNLIRVGWDLAMPIVGTTPLIPSKVGGEASWSVVTVQRGDTLWDIVDRHYGEATADLVWMVVAANPHLEDPSLIFAGQQITLPPPAGRAEEAAPPEVAPPVVAPEIAPTPPTSTTPAPTTPPSSTTPSTIPTTLAPPISTQLPVDSPPPAPAPETTEPVPATADVLGGDLSNEVGPSIAQKLGWAGGAGLAAAVIGLAARRRRRLSPSERHRCPTERAVEIGIALHETQNLSTIEWSAVALRALAVQMRPRPGEPTSIPRLLRLEDERIELVWDTPNPDLIEPWASADGGWSWTLDRSATLSTCDGPSPCPALVTIGQRDGADVLLNLESCGTLSIEGEPDAVDALARAIAFELAAGALADAPTVLLVGLPPLPAAPEATRVVDIDEAIAWLRDRADSATALLAHRRLTSLFALRARARVEDAHEAVVVVVGSDAVGSDAFDELTALAHGDLGAVVIAVGASGSASWTLRCEGGSVTLEPVGLQLTSVGLDAAGCCLVEEFVTSSDPSDDEFADPPAIDGAQLEMVLADHVAMAHQRLATPAAQEQEEELSDWDVELKVLGEVRCVGAREQLTPTELHMAVVLAFHPNGINSDTLTTLVWPNGVAERTMTNAMVSLRRKLGTGSDGELLFPLGRNTEHRYRLSSRVTTDWHRFLDLVRRSERAGEDESLGLLDEALALIDAPPFRAATGYSWAYGDGTASLITDTVSLLAQRCAERHAAQSNLVASEAALSVASRLNGTSEADSY
jgi:nucleoid-associated protein YgaU